jgi:hypothetical protein
MGLARLCRSQRAEGFPANHAKGREWTEFIRGDPRDSRAGVRSDEFCQKNKSLVEAVVVFVGGRRPPLQGAR